MTVGIPGGDALLLAGRAQAQVRAAGRLGTVGVAPDRAFAVANGATRVDRALLGGPAVFFVHRPAFPVDGGAAAEPVAALRDATTVLLKIIA